MPRIKSAKKRVKQTEKKRSANLARKSAIKTILKKVIAAMEEKNSQNVDGLLKEAQAQLARAKNKGILHAKTAARKMSRLAKKVASSKK